MNQGQNYRETLDAAALAYLQRHQTEHLGDEKLFERSVAHLVTCLGADRALAENTVARVLDQLQTSVELRYLDLSASTCSLVVIVDPISGITHSVPLYHICQLLLDDPKRKRQHAVR